jgi:hypothetical protein
MGSSSRDGGRVKYCSRTCMVRLAAMELSTLSVVRIEHGSPRPRRQACCCVVLMDLRLLRRPCFSIISCISPTFGRRVGV